ncbi:ADP-ribosylglycohydrolase [Lottiidibacillus patelloidae]|uniref:ADP-ribosylglycohydrolase n=1 Tax=Lottiidibacillus patelloidae TaxID=2670334 RepID=A0A263BRC5_9BACI|nr:ADP-ribosylglycohydrolase family protein [Lottiidibacillus patelloidae]OZM56259.1 ADP-ribosylglycohydrolase [Lottiidibacillus patelloidae]
MDKKDRFLGSMIGLAVGDAVGTTVEFKAPGTFEPINDMVGGGVFNLKPGEWTDDTSMALCLAESLIKCDGFHAKDQLERYVKWEQEGYLSSNGVCFDIGNTVSDALFNYKKTGNPYSGSTDKYSAGNGSIMRLAPIPLLYWKDFKKTIHMSGESSRTTHQAPLAIDACKYMGAIIAGALKNYSKEELLTEAFAIEMQTLTEEKWADEIREIASGSFKKLNPPEIVGSGYVVKSLEAALWAFYNSESFKEGLLLAVNLGNDADTTGAVYGQIAGAYYGVGGIPKEWREKIVLKDKIRDYSVLLYEMVEKS